MTGRTQTDRLAAGIAVMYTAGLSAWYFVWRSAFAERSADEGIFENLLWNATHGHGLQTWVESGGVPHLAVHFSPVLYLLLPLYAIAPTMHVIHVLATALIAFAGYRFFRWCARRLDDRSALALLGAFLLCPTIVLQTFMEFHEQALAVLPLTWMLIAWDEDRRTSTFLAALALLTIREDDALAVIVLGVLSLFGVRRRAFGVGLVALGVGWLAAWRFTSIQLLGGGHVPGVFEVTYGVWGRTPGEALRNMAGHPFAVLRHLVAPVPIRYLALLLAPVLFLLPFGSPMVLVALPQLLMILLAEHANRMFQIRLHFSVVPAVTALCAAVVTLAALGRSTGGAARVVRRRAPGVMLAAGLLLVPGWAGKAIGRLNPYSSDIREVLAAVPDTASITAPGYLLNHLAARSRFALEWNDDILHTNYVILEDSSRFFFRGTTVDVFFTPHLDSLLADGGYARILDSKGWHLYRRARSPETPK